MGNVLAISYEDRGESVLTTAGAKALTRRVVRKLDAIERDLVGAFNLVVEAHQRQAWRALGYPSFTAYAEKELVSSTRAIRLDVMIRREVVADLRDAGFSWRSIAAVLNVADQTARADDAKARQAGRPVVAETTRGADGRTYPGTRPAPTHRAPATTRATFVADPAATKVSNVLAALAHAGQDGLTAPEVGALLNLTHSSYSAILSELHAAKGGQRVARLAGEDGTREGMAIYVLPECVAGREVEAPGRRVRRITPAVSESPPTLRA